MDLWTDSKSLKNKELFRIFFKKIFVLLSASHERFGVSRMQYFFLHYFVILCSLLGWPTDPQMGMNAFMKSPYNLRYFFSPPNPDDYLFALINKKNI